MEIFHIKLLALISLIVTLTTAFSHLLSNYTSEIDTHSSENRYLEFEKFRQKHVPKHGSKNHGLYKAECETLRSIDCTLCKLVVTGLKELAAKGSTQEEVVKYATEACIILKIEDERVCRSITVEFKDELFGVAQALVLSPEEACGTLIGSNCGTPYDPSYMWNVTIPPGLKPAVTPYTPPKPGSPTVRILHISDIHLDPKYAEGTKTDCGEPLCCRVTDGKPDPGKPGAGRWGSLSSCDLPLLTLENMLQYLASIKDQFDYIVFTGDLPPHNIWNQTKTDQITSLQTYTNLMKKYLPDKTIYNTMGNHESAPVNSFPPPTVKGQNMTWLYTAVAESWGLWLPKDTKADIVRGGFYTVLIKPGFRLVSLNMNYCNNGNWWLLINTTDPVGQLQWLVSVLQNAENTKEKVHIIGHIHPGSSVCLKAWSWNYYRIVNRYENTVAGQFFGHAHPSFYAMVYDDVKFTRPVSIIYVPGSVTTFSNLNPGYRIYTVDGFYENTTWSVLDYSNYYLNLTDVNKSNNPKWILEYNAKTEYNLSDLSPGSWNQLINRMKTDDVLFQKFYRHYNKLAPTSVCTGKCKTDILCLLKSGRSGDPDLCKDIYDEV